MMNETDQQWLFHPLFAVSPLLLLLLQKVLLLGIGLRDSCCSTQSCERPECQCSAKAMADHLRALLMRDFSPGSSPQDWPPLLPLAAALAPAPQPALRRVQPAPAPHRPP